MDKKKGIKEIKKGNNEVKKESRRVKRGKRGCEYSNGVEIFPSFLNV